jgi:hypothetical protein
MMGNPYWVQEKQRYPEVFRMTTRGETYHILSPWENQKSILQSDTGSNHQGRLYR